MELQSLQSIFNNRIFRIPDYQRGYSWDDKQLQDLWRDIDILGKDQSHYTGVLSVVTPKNGKNSTTHIHIVDGQQRITTLVILIQVICNCEQLKDQKWINSRKKQAYVEKYLHYQTGVQGERTELVFGYEKDNPSHFYFKTEILELSDTDIVAERTLYTLNLKYAKKFFGGKVKDMDIESLEKLLGKITENLKFNYYELDDELSEFVAFETMNNRGKPLSDLELLKNRLIYLSTLLPNNDEDKKKDLRVDINNAWKTVYEYLGKNPKKVLTDDDFLKDHWIMCYPYSREGVKEYAKFLLERHFTAERIKSEDVKLGDIRNYVFDVQKAVKAFFYLHNPDHSDFPYSGEVKTWMGKLNRLGFKAFRPLVGSILANKVEDSKVLQVLKFAEQYNFVTFDVHNRYTNTGDTQIYNYANRVHHCPSDLVPENFLTMIGISNSCRKETFCEYVDRSWQRFYDWKGIRYFLYEYELHLQQSKTDGAKVKWENVNTETIEHIYPRNPAEGCWNEFLPDDATRYLHNMGNLLLLSRAMNSKLKNREFATKKKEFKSGSYSAIEVATPNEEWTPERIVNRTEKLFAFMQNRWNIKFTN